MDVDRSMCYSTRYHFSHFIYFSCCFVLALALALQFLLMLLLFLRFKPYIQTPLLILLLMLCRCHVIHWAIWAMVRERRRRRKKKHGERNAIQDMADVGWMDGSRADEHRTNAESERKIEEKKHTEIEVENRRADTE